MNLGNVISCKLLICVKKNNIKLFLYYNQMCTGIHISNVHCMGTQMINLFYFFLRVVSYFNRVKLVVPHKFIHFHSVENNT